MRVNRKKGSKKRGELEGKFISIVTWFKIEFHKSSAVREPFAYFTRKTKRFLHFYFIVEKRKFSRWRLVVR